MIRHTNSQTAGPLIPAAASSTRRLLPVVVTPAAFCWSVGSGFSAPARPTGTTDPIRGASVTNGAMPHTWSVTDALNPTNHPHLEV